MSRDQIKLISSYTTLPCDVIIHWKKHGGDIELLFKQVKNIGYLMGTGFCALPWQHHFLMPTGKMKIDEKFIADCVTTSADSYGNTVAHYVALTGNVPLLEAIYAKDASKLLEKNQHGFSVAHFAAFSKEGVSVLAWLSSVCELAHLPKTPTDKKSAIFVLPTHIATYSGYVENLTWFKKNHPETVRIDLNSKWHFDECSLLDHALLSGNPDMPNIAAEFLGIQCGADLSRATRLSLETLSAVLRRAPRLFGSVIYKYVHSTPAYSEDNVRQYSETMKVVKESFAYLAFMFLLPLTQGVRNHHKAIREGKNAETSLRITVDTFWRIADFLVDSQYESCIKARIFQHGFFGHEQYRYKPDVHIAPDGINNSLMPSTCETPSFST